MYSHCYKLRTIRHACDLPPISAIFSHRQSLWFHALGTTWNKISTFLNHFKLTQMFSTMHPCQAENCVYHPLYSFPFASILYDAPLSPPRVSLYPQNNPVPSIPFTAWTLFKIGMRQRANSTQAPSITDDLVSEIVPINEPKHPTSPLNLLSSILQNYFLQTLLKLETQTANVLLQINYSLHTESDYFKSTFKNRNCCKDTG